MSRIFMNQFKAGERPALNPVKRLTRSELYLELINQHDSLRQEIRVAYTRYKDTELRGDIVGLKRARQKMVSLFMDALLLDPSEDSPVFVDTASLKVSTYSEIFYLRRSLLAFHTALFPEKLKPLTSRDENAARIIVESLELKNDFKKSWLSKVGSPFWEEVVKNREIDAKRKLSSYFDAISPYQLTSALKTLDQAKQRELIEFCFRLEDLYQSLKQMNHDHWKIPVNFDIQHDLSPSVSASAQGIESVRSKFIFFGAQHSFSLE